MLVFLNYNLSCARRDKASSIGYCDGVDTIGRPQEGAPSALAAPRATVERLTAHWS
jgi:hypothetical protein